MINPTSCYTGSNETSCARSILFQQRPILLIAWRGRIRASVLVLRIKIGSGEGSSNENRRLVSGLAGIPKPALETSWPEDSSFSSLSFSLSASLSSSSSFSQFQASQPSGRLVRRRLPWKVKDCPKSPRVLWSNKKWEHVQPPVVFYVYMHFVLETYLLHLHERISWNAFSFYEPFSPNSGYKSCVSCPFIWRLHLLRFGN